MSVIADRKWARSIEDLGKLVAEVCANPKDEHRVEVWLTTEGALFYNVDPSNSNNDIWVVDLVDVSAKKEIALKRPELFADED